MNTFERANFDHIGIPSDEPRRGEIYVPETKVWITSPRDNPANVEWVRFEDGSPVTGPLRHMPHLAYRTLDVEAAIEGHDVLLEPFVVADRFLKAAFVLVDGAPIELMQYRDPNETGWYS